MTASSLHHAPEVVVAVDQGTGSTKATAIDRIGTVIARASVPVSRSDPRPGWVEQDPLELRDSVTTAIAALLDQRPLRVAGVGLSNQRESAVVWDRGTGQPLGPMLGWQDRRTADRAAAASQAGWAEEIRSRTGLPLDPMFSALKLEWLLDQVDPDRAGCRSGRIAVGTVDSWLLFCLTGEHRIEIGNASRTQLLNLEQVDWDAELAERFRIPTRALPRLANSAEESDPLASLSPILKDARIHAVLGDSHAALYANGVRTPGRVKVTYGSGSSIIALSGEAPAAESAGLVRTIAWGTGRLAYALEGTVLATGSTLVWLSELFGTDPYGLSRLAESAASSGGVDLVPAFSGLGAPFWDPQAQAIISGFGLGTTQAEIARAAFESITLQTADVLTAVERAAGGPLTSVLIDGGPAQNDWLAQRQADLSQLEIQRNNVAELSAIGAAHLAGVSCGFWSEQECEALGRDRTRFAPSIGPEQARDRRERWAHAIRRSRLQPAPAEAPLTR